MLVISCHNLELCSTLPLFLRARVSALICSRRRLPSWHMGRLDHWLFWTKSVA